MAGERASVTPRLIMCDRCRYHYRPGRLLLENVDGRRSAHCLDEQACARRVRLREQDRRDVHGTAA